jgi:hypothetical protein
VKHFFLELAQIEFSDGQEVDYEFRPKGAYFKLRLIDLQKFAFWNAEKGKKKCLQVLRIPAISISRRHPNNYSLLQEAKLNQTENHIQN